MVYEQILFEKAFIYSFFLTNFSNAWKIWSKLAFSAVAVLMSYVFLSTSIKY